MTTFHCSLNNELKFFISNDFSRMSFLLLVERNLMETIQSDWDTIIIFVLGILCVYIFSYLRRQK